MKDSKLKGTGNLEPQHLAGGKRRENPVMEVGVVPEKPDSVHGVTVMDTTEDEDVIKDTIVETFKKQSRKSGYGFTRENLRFQTFDNGDGTMTVVFDAG